ncbi:ATPase [Pseudolysinimonas kribbensis]|uniref:ATPase n=1 Tax=Pseudolysinimonas kribbensis TaxID=433641 RepID=A0ABQ6K335_9MICO|nr:ATPase [Pseudolysinimonas kribbensis]
MSFVNNVSRLDRLVGIDVGGTKTHLAAIGPDGARRDVIRPSADWRHDMLFSDDGNLPRLAEWIATHAVVGPGTSVAVGLHDGDTEQQLALARDVLSGGLGIRVRVENDGELIVPAAGPEPAIALVVGTGSIVSGRDADGRQIGAGGHGWMLGDWGSAPGLVREALVRVLPLVDDGIEDAIIPLLADAFGVAVHDLATSTTVDASQDRWGDAAPVVFSAADAGSAVALETIEDAADRLVAEIASVQRRGALGEKVVAAGGVVSSQPRLRAALAARLAVLPRPLGLQLLEAPPVDGALRLAADAAAV